MTAGTGDLFDALPERVVVGSNGAYWRDFGTHYSMCVVSTDNDPVEPIAVYVRAEVISRVIDAAVKTALPQMQKETSRG